MAWSTWSTMASVLSTAGVTNVLAPQLRASWLRVDSKGVRAISGRVVCSRESRRTVLPVAVNATRALASSRSPMSLAA